LILSLPKSANAPKPIHAPDSRISITSATFSEARCDPPEPPYDAALNMNMAITKKKMLRTYLFRNMRLPFERMDNITLSLFGASQEHRFSAPPTSRIKEWNHLLSGAF